MLKKKSAICPTCGTRVNENMSGIKEYWYCKKCALGWVKQYQFNPYDDNYYGGKSLLATIIFSPIEEIFYKIRNNYVGKRDTNLWIDVGAGDGGYLRRVNAKKKIGVEISESGRKIMKSHGLQTMDTREFLKKDNLNADFISFWQVLEHVENPIDYLKSAERNIKPRGKIIIAVPNHKSFEFAVFGRYWFHLLPQYHIWHFSLKSLGLLLAKAHLKPESIDYWAIEHHLTGVLQSFVNKSTESDSVLHRLLKRRHNFSTLSLRDIFWITVWCTIGFPIVLLFWIVGAVFHRSGTLVLIASKNSK